MMLPRNSAPPKYFRRLHIDSSQFIGGAARIAGPSASMIRSHNLARPTETSAVESIGRVVGMDQAKATWQRARERAGIRNGSNLSLSELMAVADELTHFDGFIGVMGTALRIRIRTYQILGEEENASQRTSARIEV